MSFKLTCFYRFIFESLKREKSHGKITPPKKRALAATVSRVLCRRSEGQVCVLLENLSRVCKRVACFPECSARRSGIPNTAGGAEKEN